MKMRNVEIFDVTKFLVVETSFLSCNMNPHNARETFHFDRKIER